MRRKIDIPADLAEVIRRQKPYSQKGYSCALSSLDLLESTVTRASEELQAEISRLDASNLRDDVLYNSLSDQLNIIRSRYTSLPSLLRNDIEMLSQKEFTITVFGRTTAGKSTLMETLTHGNGKTIGKGGQRTTRSVRRYKYKSLCFVDVPGVAAVGGDEDQEIAYNAAKKSDLILFIMKDDDVQPAVADALGKIESLGKPVICLVNVKAGIDIDELSDDAMEMFRFDLREKMTKEHLEGIKKQLLEYGEKLVLK